jgi:hypothetical protein
MKHLIILCVLVSILAACAANPISATTGVLTTATIEPTNIPEPTKTTEYTPTAQPTISPTPSPLPLQLPGSPQYDIRAELDYGWKKLTAQQQVTIYQPSDQTLDEIVLVVQPNWYPGTFQLDEINWREGSPISDYVLDGILLRIPLSESWQPGTQKELSMGFTLNLPTLDRGEEFGPNPFGYTTRQINLTDWHPFVPPFVDGEWLVHNPWFYGEHLVYPVADYQVEIRLVNAPDGTVMAANALDQGQGDTHIYQLDQARNFVLSVSPEYHVFQEEVEGVTLLGYSFPFDIAIGEAAFQATVEAFKLYSQLFGPYPHESLSMVQADFLHGMEYDGLYFLSKAFFNTYDGTPASYLVAIAVHETAHQWWFGLVANDQAMEPWLDEALCTFAERLYYENLYPESLKWWLDYRVNFYEPQGWVDMTIYDSGGYRPYRDAVYLNGMNFLTELRDLVGTETFTLFLQDYLDRNAKDLATAPEFFDILREYSDADWTNLKMEYFQNP